MHRGYLADRHSYQNLQEAHLARFCHVGCQLSGTCRMPSPGELPALPERQLPGGQAINGRELYLDSSFVQDRYSGQQAQVEGSKGSLFNSAQ